LVQVHVEEEVVVGQNHGDEGIGARDEGLALEVADVVEEAVHER